METLLSYTWNLINTVAQTSPVGKGSTLLVPADANNKIIIPIP